MIDWLKRNVLHTPQPDWRWVPYAPGQKRHILVGKGRALCGYATHPSAKWERDCAYSSGDSCYPPPKCGVCQSLYEQGLWNPANVLP